MHMHTKINEEKLRQYLRAIEGTNDEKMKQNNLHPESLRAQFYKDYTKTYECVSKKHIIHSEIPYPDYLVIKTKDWDEWNEEEHETGKDVHEFFVIAKPDPLTDKFVTFLLHQQIPMTRRNIWPEWTTFVRKDVIVNFVDIVCNYHLFMLDICERWGFLPITRLLKEISNKMHH